MSKEFYGSGNEQDVPDIQSGLTSSVGALWPPDRASFARIKGIYAPAIIEDDSHMLRLLGAITDAVQIFNPDDITRVSLRAVLDRSFLDESLVRNPLLLNVVEARMQLDGSQNAFLGKDLVYFGLNHSSRESDPTDSERFAVNLEDAHRYSKRSAGDITGRVVEQGYAINTLPRDIPDFVVDQVSELYSRFGWSPEQVMQIITAPNNIVAVASLGDQIVSAGIAEMIAVPIGGNNLRIAEITEAATLDGHGGRGLYTAVSTSLIRELGVRSRAGDIFGDELDLVYGECNANAPGVLRTATIQGRAFSHGNGKLRQHVPIAGLPIATPYNDLFPTYMTRNELYRFTS